MTSLTRRRPTTSFTDLLDWFETWPPVTEWRHEGTHAVRVEDRMEEGRYVLRAELPGIDPEKDVTVSVTDRVLTIRAERREETRTDGRSEFQYGSFERRLTLPANALVDTLSARYEDGILEVTVPLAEDAEQPRVIPVERPTS
jgi:HSP20 family protein